ncbi:MAG: hypothetical protein V2A67_10660 [Bacteroidota bacterium]
MKVKVAVLATIASILFTTQGFGQFTFGVSPGITSNGAYFGYTIASRVVPYVGFQYANAKFSVEMSGDEFDWDANEIVPYDETMAFSGNLCIPSVGVKVFFLEVNQLKAFGLVDFSKPMVSAKTWSNGELNEEFVENVKNFSSWGGELAVGAEYFFDDNFSVGGEFGIRHLAVKYNDTYDSTIYDPNTDQEVPTEITQSISGSMSPTFARVSVNFYFGGNKK